MTHRFANFQEFVSHFYIFLLILQPKPSLSGGNNGALRFICRRPDGAMQTNILINNITTHTQHTLSHFLGLNTESDCIPWNRP